MLAVQILMLCIILILIPAAVGFLFYPLSKGGAVLPFCWVSGQLLLWAVFELLCVPMILMRGSFYELFQSFCICTLALALLSVGVDMRRKSKGNAAVYVKKGPEKDRSRQSQILWALFILLLLVQVILAIVLAYEEGDDAYYVAVSSISIDADNMYVKYPYTGGEIPLDVRHALAPFPVWVSVVAKLSGMAPVSVCHVALPISMLLMAYGIYYLIGEKLLSGKKGLLPYYMVLVELLVMVGGYSLYTSERFLLVRAAQGKAVLGNIVIPFLLLLLYMLVDHIHRKEKLQLNFWVLLLTVMITGCLCSTLGTFLLCLFAGVVGLCIVVCYREWKFLLPLGICMVPPVGCALLYFVMG